MCISAVCLTKPTNVWGPPLVIGVLRGLAAAVLRIYVLESVEMHSSRIVVLFDVIASN